jgi:hypothetical protein
MAAESTVMNMEARLKISFQVMVRVASRLQCSVARIWARTASVTPLRSESAGRVVEVVGNESLMVLSFGGAPATRLVCGGVRTTDRHAPTC